MSLRALLPRTARLQAVKRSCSSCHLYNQPLPSLASSSRLHLDFNPLQCCPNGSPSSSQKRSYKSFVRIRSPSGKGSARVPLTSSVYGHATSRGTRPYQEDTASVSCLEINADELRASLRKGGRIATEAERRWHWPDEHEELDEELAAQVNWWGIYDGHGGDYTSRYLAMNLHQIFEKVTEDMITDTVQYTREHGGYFRRFTGGALDRWVQKDELKPVRGGKAGKKPGSEKNKSNGSKGDDQDGANGETSSSATEEQSGTAGASEAERIQAGDEPVHAATASPTAPRKPNAPPAAQWDDNGLTKRIPVPEGMEKESLSLSERATLAFMVADRHILVRHPQLPSPDATTHGDAHRGRGIQTRDMEARASKEKAGGDGGGSTASVLTLHSLDAPPVVWYDSQFLLLGGWHVG